MVEALRTLGAILRVPFYRWLSLALFRGYLTVFLLALGDLSLGGGDFEFATVEWRRGLERAGAFTFQPVARLTLPGLTFLLSPVNLAIGALLSGLAGLNLAVTVLALRQPRACRFNRSAGILASVPALLAGSACCAPAIVLLLGLQVSSLMMGVFQVLIPISLGLLLVTLKLILDRTEAEMLEAS